MAETLSQFIGQIRKSRDAELAQKMQALVPLMQFEQQKRRSEEAYATHLGKVRNDLSLQFTDQDLRDEFDSTAAQTQTLEGMQNSFASVMGKQKTRTYGKAMSGIYGMAWGDDPATEQLSQGIATAQSPEEIDAYIKTLEPQYQNRRRISQLSTLADGVLDDKTKTAMSTALAQTTDPAVQQQILNQYLGKADTARASKYMADEFTRKGMDPEMVAQFQEQAAGARTVQEIQAIAESFEQDMTKGQSREDYAALIGLEDQTMASEFKRNTANIDDPRVLDSAFKYYTEKGANNKALADSKANYASFLQSIDPALAEEFTRNTSGVTTPQTIQAIADSLIKKYDQEKPKSVKQIDTLAAESLGAEGYKEYTRLKGLPEYAEYPTLALNDAMRYESDQKIIKEEQKKTAPMTEAEARKKAEGLRKAYRDKFENYLKSGYTPAEALQQAAYDQEKADAPPRSSGGGGGGGGGGASHPGPEPPAVTEEYRKGVSNVYNPGTASGKDFSINGYIVMNINGKKSAIPAITGTDGRLYIVGNKGMYLVHPNNVYPKDESYEMIYNKAMIDKWQQPKQQPQGTTQPGGGIEGFEHRKVTK